MSLAGCIYFYIYFSGKDYDSLSTNLSGNVDGREVSNVISTVGIVSGIVGIKWFHYFYFILKKSNLKLGTKK